MKTAGGNINSLRCTDDTALMAESEEELKSLLMKVKEERGKVGLKFNIQKTRIIASGPIISWQINGRWGKSGNSDRFYFLGLQTSLQMVIRTIKFKTLAPWKKSYDRPTASLYSCESWTIKLSPEELMFSNFGAGEDS